jgi:hypothetical protein
VDVEPADQGERELDGLPRRGDPHPRPCRVGREDRALNIAERLDPVRDDLRALRAVGEVAPVLVVAVQHRGLGYSFVGGAREHREELAFGLQVFLKRPVKIEMLGGEIGEYGDVDLRPAQLPQREGVTGRLEHAPRSTRDE